MRLARFCRRILGMRKVPVALWLHGPLSFHAGIEKNLPTADGHICICRERADEIRQALSQLAPGLDPPICIAYNGTSVDKKYSVRRAKTPVFVYMGRILFEDQKRVVDIVQAAARLRGEFRIQFVGDGPEEDKQRLLQVAKSTGVSEKLEWLGWQSEPWAVIPFATALILASSYEGFSMVMAEALMLGVPILCSEFGATASEVIIPGKTGWTFAVGDVAGLAAIMQSLIDGSVPLPRPEEVRRIGAKFSTESMAESFRSALETMRARKSGNA